MQMEIREKLKQIAELYPEERLKKSKERWRKVWAVEPPDDRYPFLYYPVIVDYYNTINTKEERLKLFLDEFIARGFLQDDFIPAFFPGCRQGTIPGMFGSKEIVCAGDYTCEKIINCTQDIYRLPEPAILPNTPAYEWLEMEKYFLDECEGKIPVHVCDMQGPMDVCAQLWRYDELFICAHEDEEAFDYLMRLAIRAFIVLWEEQKKLCKDLFIPTHMYGWTWQPSGTTGGSISVDSMSMISDTFFCRFYAPYIREMGQYFNGLTVHSCGNFSAVVKSLSALPEVKAVNASQMTVMALHKAGWDPKKVIVTKDDYDNIPMVFDYVRTHGMNVEMCVKELWKTDDRGLAVNPPGWTIDELKELSRRSDDLIKCLHP